MLLVLVLPSALVPATMANFLCVPQSRKGKERKHRQLPVLSPRTSALPGCRGGSLLLQTQQKVLSFLGAEGTRA